MFLNKRKTCCGRSLGTHSQHTHRPLVLFNVTKQKLLAEAHYMVYLGSSLVACMHTCIHTQHVCSRFCIHVLVEGLQDLWYPCLTFSSEEKLYTMAHICLWRSLLGVHIAHTPMIIIVNHTKWTLIPRQFRYMFHCKINCSQY